MAEHPKPKSQLGKLPQDVQEKVFLFVEGGTLAKAQAWLRDEWELDLSASTISRWATKYRTDKASAEFQLRLIELTAARNSAVEMKRQLGDLGVINEANLGLLSQAFLNAQISGDTKTIKALGFLFTATMDSVSKLRRADAAVADSITSQQKFQFDAAKIALKHAAKLQEINKSTATEKEKVERAVIHMFGTKPEGLVTDAPEEVQS